MGAWSYLSYYLRIYLSNFVDGRIYPPIFLNAVLIFIGALAGFISLIAKTWIKNSWFYLG